MVKVFARLVADLAFIGALLFAAAGTLAWPRAWTLLAVLLVVRVSTAVVVGRVNRELLVDRARAPLHHGQPASDRLLVLGVIATGFVGLPVVAALDVFRWHLFARPAPVISAAGLALFGAGWAFKGMALYANAFATSAVRLQSERQHTVADRGAYGVIRHPFYAGTVCVFLGMSLWLESYFAARLVVIPIALIALRIVHEERFLRRQLAGYANYAARVPWRVIPGIW